MKLNIISNPNLTTEEVGYIQGYSEVGEHTRKIAMRLLKDLGAGSPPSRIIQADGSFCPCAGCWDSLQGYYNNIEMIAHLLATEREWLLNALKKAGLEL